MKKRRLATIALASAMMVTSFAACGNSESGTTGAATQADTAAATSEAATDSTKDTEAVTERTTEAVVANPSVDFEDGKFGFTKMNVLKGNPDDSVLSVADFSGSKALKAENTNGGNMYVGINVDALLGAEIAKVAKIQFSIGTGSKDGKFSAASGKVYTYTGTDLVETEAAKWSVYMETANPKTYTFDVSGFVAGSNNYIIISKETDNAKTAQDLYIDSIAFIDADGNVLKANTDAEFGNPAGFAKEGKDIALVYIDNPTELAGFQVSADGWNQAGIDVTDEMRALFKPGCVIEIAYKCTDPVWLVNISSDANPNPAGTWLRGINGETYVPTGYVSTDGSVVQYTYEQLVEFWGEGWENTIVTLQAEGKDAWQVYSVKVGQQSNYRTLGSATELEGFQVSADGWNQAGIDLTDDMRALLKPGSVIEISYKCTDPVWMVDISSDANPNPAGTWLRAVNTDTYETSGSVNEEGTVVQFTYEQLAEFWGDNWEDTCVVLQCEGKDAWEVYSVKVGKPVQPMTGATEIPGFAVSADGWNQAGVALSEDILAKIKPGCVFTIYYKCSDPVWFVNVGSDPNPNPLGNWLRAVNGETYIVDGAVGDGFVQYTYEQLAQYWGENWETYSIGQLQCEGKDTWEVYKVVVGQGASAAPAEKAAEE